MEHNALIAEVPSELHPNVIKKRIEGLIEREHEREFLERDKYNWRKYKCKHLA